jgi:hypothetical protein
MSLAHLWLPIVVATVLVFVASFVLHVALPWHKRDFHVIRRDGGDRYAIESSIATARGARTGLFVPADSALYVAAPASGDAPARILAFRAH